jgi:hypothetical protein
MAIFKEREERYMELYLVEHDIKVGTFFEGKMIGITSTKEKAEKIIKEYKKKTGFKKYKNGFRIKRMELDKSYHGKGFKSWYEKGRE